VPQRAIVGQGTAPPDILQLTIAATHHFARMKHRSGGGYGPIGIIAPCGPFLEYKAVSQAAQEKEIGASAPGIP
jgi:hypothetical protein